MSIVNRLFLHIPDTSVETTIVVEDHSAYTDIPLTGRLLEIWMPGYLEPVLIGEDLLPQSFRLNVTASTLGIQPEGSTVPAILPDGLYRFRFSADGGHVTELNHLRTARISNLWSRELCKIHFQDCEPSREQKETLDQLRLIKVYIEGAKAKAEYCNAPSQGLEILAYAEKMLMKFVFKGCSGGDCRPCSNCSPCTNC
jgi:hypothetical protein